MLPPPWPKCVNVQSFITIVLLRTIWNSYEAFIGKWILINVIMNNMEILQRTILYTILNIWKIVYTIITIYPNSLA